MTQNANEAKKSRSFVEQSVFPSSIHSSMVGIHFLFIESRKKLFSLPFLLFRCSSFKNEWVVASQQHHKRQQKAFQSYFFYFTVLSCIDQITQVVQFCLSFQCNLILQVRLHSQLPILSWSWTIFTVFSGFSDLSKIRCEFKQPGLQLNLWDFSLSNRPVCTVCVAR